MSGHTRRGFLKAIGSAAVSAEALSLRLGTVELSKGRTTLAVKALKIPGRQALDLKAVQLRRMD